MKRFMLIQLCLLLTTLLLWAQSDDQTYFVMSYNVENLFDTQDDSLFNDTEYLPGNLRGWSYKRYQQKLFNISKVIATSCGWNPPILVGLCEIENRHVLNDLTRHAPLKNLDYHIIHYESPDARGVDVALLYRHHLFTPICSRPIAVHFTMTPTQHTRDILYVCGILPAGDTIHIFVNHFPSRLGGELESENRRIDAARVLRHAVDSVQATNQQAKILIMGDFNDYPDNKSILHVLQAEPFYTDTKPQTAHLYNLCYAIHEKGQEGSYKHDGVWGMLDQFIVSGDFLTPGNGTMVDGNSLRIYSPEWLLEPDKIVGYKPFRTYIGYRFNNGFSDHLPIVVQLIVNATTENQK